MVINVRGKTLNLCLLWNAKEYAVTASEAESGPVGNKQILSSQLLVQLTLNNVIISPLVSLMNLEDEIIFININTTLCNSIVFL